jgi:hypothetical protein
VTAEQAAQDQVVILILPVGLGEILQALQVVQVQVVVQVEVRVEILILLLI